MTARDFFAKLIEAFPSRGLDNVEIRISDRETYDVFEIVNISNFGNNDMIEIEIQRK